MVGLPMWNVFNCRWLHGFENSAKQVLQTLEKVRFSEFFFQMPEILEVWILGVIHRVLHGLVQDVEFGHTVVECPHILLQIAEHLLLNKLIETSLAEIVPTKALDLDEVVEESGEPHLVVLLLAVLLHLLGTIDIQPIETVSKLFLIQHGAEEVKFLPVLNL